MRLTHNKLSLASTTVSIDMGRILQERDDQTGCSDVFLHDPTLMGFSSFTGIQGYLTSISSLVHRLRAFSRKLPPNQAMYLSRNIMYIKFHYSNSIHMEFAGSW